MSTSILPVRCVMSIRYLFKRTVCTVVSGPFERYCGEGRWTSADKGGKNVIIADTTLLDNRVGKVDMPGFAPCTWLVQ